MLALAAMTVLLGVLLAVVMLLHARERAQLLGELRHAHNLIAARNPAEAAVLERAQQPRPAQPAPTKPDTPTLPYIGD